MPPFPESPRCLSPFQGNLFSLHCLDLKPRIDSHHGGTWDSPVGKLPGASVRNPARDKVMRKEADIRKACSDFRDPSANS